MDRSKDRLINLGWSLGVRAFRLSRRMRLSHLLEPAFVAVAKFVPQPRRDTVASIGLGATLVMPAGYRDTRTVVTGLFQRDETQLFKHVIQRGMTVLDIGAYVGYFTVLASVLVGSGGRVIAFEPEPVAYNYLLRNVTANKCTNVAAVNMAVSANQGMTLLVRDPSGPESFTTSDDHSIGETVQTTSLDSYFERENSPTVDLIKMNIEGSELVALAGMRATSFRNPQLQLVMEFNPRAMERARVTHQALCQMLIDLGFRSGYVVERNLQPLPTGRLLPIDSAVYNLLLKK